MTNGSAGQHRHVVGVYDCDADLVPAVVSFLAEALAVGGTAVVVVTPDRRAAIDAALVSSGFELERLQRAGRYRVLDAARTLPDFMRGDHPDPAALASVMGGLLDECSRAGTPVHVFGEMVGLLWHTGNRAGAIELESLWNDLGRDHSFALFCAYALAALETSGDLAAVKQMCDQHSGVIPLRARSAEPVTTSSGGADLYERLFLASLAAPRRVREFVREVLRLWGDEAIDHEVEVVASELATNAVTHAASPFRVSVARGSGALRIAVRDASFDQPEQLLSDAARAGGRGIQLVSALARAWGIDAEPDGKTVWAEVARR